MIKECGNNCFTLDNGLIKREITFDSQGLYTSSLINLTSGTEYVKKPAIDFSFISDDVKYISFTIASVREVDGLKEEIKNPFNFSGSRISTLADGSQTLAVEMQTSSGLAVTVTYRIYPGIAGVRKNIAIRNAGGKTIKIRNIVFDNPVFMPGTPADCEFYFDFDRPSLPLFSTEAYEDVIRCYNPVLKEGWFLGTNAPGVMRNFVVFPHWNSIQCACNRGGANLLKELAPGEVFTSPDSLWCCCNGDLEDQNTVDGFRRLVRAGLPELKYKEGVMYCTWLPFLRNISASLVDELSSRAADLGFEYFVIDDGWFKLKSNWQVDLEKFPEGLEEVSRKIREKGLKFGLWFNVGTDYGAIRTKQEYVQKLSDGTDKFFDENSERKVLCFGSGHRQDMLEAMSELAEKYKVSYFKLDFSSAFSPYSFQSWGCHSKDHEYHKGFNDSIPAIYAGMMYLRTELQKRFPGILVDFSFECFGTQMPNIAALEYSDLHHVSNYSANTPFYQKIDSIRRAFYNWLRVLPPERILNGLLSIQGDRAGEYLLSSFAGAPLVAGDLRAVPQEQNERMAKFVSAFKSAVSDGALTSFELVCNSRERDGFIRKNSSGKGIVCLFNRTDEVWRPDIRNCRNVETGSETVEVAPHDCAMFLLG